MAATLVQPQLTCACSCHTGHHHHQHHQHHDRLSHPSYAVAGYPTAIVGAVSTSGAEHQHTFTTAPTITTAGNGSVISALEEPRLYPFQGGHVKHTHASFRRDSLPELTPHATNATTALVISNGHHANGKPVIAAPLTPLTPAPSQSGGLDSPKAINSWALCLPIPIPHGLSNTTLESVTYTIRYASLNAGSASVQTDIVLARGAKLGVEGVVTDYSKVPLYTHYGEGKGHGGGYGPPMLNGALGLELLSVPAFKQGAAGGGWSHYLDHQKVYPNVRIGEAETYAHVAQGHTHVPGHVHSYGSSGHTSAEEGCHVYLFFHVYEYPEDDALRSLSIDISATWNDGDRLRRLKEEREHELHELRAERERLVLMKRDVEVTIAKLEESVKRANEESERRVKGEREMEKELLEREEELLEFERKAKESYKGRLSEEAERLKKLDEKEKETRVLFEKRTKVEEERLKAIEEAEKKAKAEYEKRMKEEEERLKAIVEAEEQAEAQHERRVSEEETKMKEIEEAQRRLKEEAEQKAKEDAERRAREEAEWKAHEEAERKAREDAERWAKEQAALRKKEEEEHRARIEAENRAREEAERSAREAAERREREEKERREREEKERQEREEAERRAREEAERKAKEEAEREEAERRARAVPSVADAPVVADVKMQEHIATIAAKLGQKCKNGYAWEKKAHGYKCSGGGHFISFKDLGMN